MCERGSHSFTCHPQVKWGVAAFTPQPRSISTHWPLLISFPVGDLNWPGNDNCTQDYMFWSVYVCTLVCCAKMAEQIMSQFGGRLRYGSKEPCIKWGGGADPLLRADMYVCRPVVKYRHPVVCTVQRGDHVFVLIAQLLPLKLEHRGAHWCGQCWWTEAVVSMHLVFPWIASFMDMCKQKHMTFPGHLLHGVFDTATHCQLLT